MEDLFLTVVEFYDRTPVENVISSLTIVPDKIIFIGDGKVMEKSKSVYRSFFQARGLKTEPDFRNINRNNLSNIVEVLSSIVETEEQCVFDLTGGDDLVLVAMGIVFQKYPDKNIQMQRFNVRNGVVTDCDNDGTVLYSGSPALSVEENIYLNGGTVRYENENEKEERTFKWDLSDDFVKDIEKMWNICRTDPGLWNSRLNVLEAFEEFATDSSLNVAVNLSAVEEHLKHVGIKNVPVKGLLMALNRNRLIYSYIDSGQNISFTYKNEQVKKCLIKSGTALEMKVLITANSLKNKDGTPFYTDSMNGVYIDWDGDLHNATDKEKDTENEIDVVLMKGMTPVFISCKNGQVGEDELYKLDAVANRFGGLYVKKVLIATYLGKKGKSMEYFRQRAKDMKINLIDGVHLKNDQEFAKMVKSLTSN